MVIIQQPDSGEPGGTSALGFRPEGLANRWAALTHGGRVAKLVAGARHTPEIGGAVLGTQRPANPRLSHIMAKLGARSASALSAPPWASHRLTR
jgi:hypothetical protein